MLGTTTESMKSIILVSRGEASKFGGEIDGKFAGLDSIGITLITIRSETSFDIALV